jgi:sRNA-binding carbon storage regulator CsrA
MTWVKGETGMRLRTVLAHRALHVEKVLHAEAVKKGIAAPKSTTFYQRELAPMFKDGLSSSSEDDDDGDDEARKARVARRIEEQKQLMRLKRSEEDKKAIDTLRLRRLKEKYTR